MRIDWVSIPDKGRDYYFPCHYVQTDLGPTAEGIGDSFLRE
jgi:hypothetical protein